MAKRFFFYNFFISISSFSPVQLQAEDDRRSLSLILVLQFRGEKLVERVIKAFFFSFFFLSTRRDASLRNETRSNILQISTDLIYAGAGSPSYVRSVPVRYRLSSLPIAPPSRETSKIFEFLRAIRIQTKFTLQYRVIFIHPSLPPALFVPPLC